MPLSIDAKNVFNRVSDQLKPFIIKSKPFFRGYAIFWVAVQLPVSFVVVAYKGIKNRDEFSFKRSAIDFTRYAFFPWAQMITGILGIGKKKGSLKPEPRINPPQNNKKPDNIVKEGNKLGIESEIEREKPKDPVNFTSQQLSMFTHNKIALAKPELNNELLNAAFSVTPETRKDFAKLYAQQDAATLQAARELLDQNIYANYLSNFCNLLLRRNRGLDGPKGFSKSECSLWKIR